MGNFNQDFQNLNQNDHVDTKLIIMLSTLLFSGMMILCMLYICFFDIIYQDSYGNPVVCDVDGAYYSADHPTCKEALKGKWQRNSPVVWQGTCDAKGICIPAFESSNGDGK